MWTIGPGAAREFPPWVVSAYRIAVKHGFRGTEREFRIAMAGRDGVDCLPMLLVTEDEEAAVPDEYEAYMRPSGDEYIYETERNVFRSADHEIPVPDGLTLDGRELTLLCEGEAMGTPAQLPETDLPAVTTADNGKVIKVVSGAWAAGTL